MCVCVWVCGYWCGQQGSGCLDDPGTLASGSACNRWIIQGGQRRQAFPAGRDRVPTSHLWRELGSLPAALSQLCFWKDKSTFYPLHLPPPTRSVLQSGRTVSDCLAYRSLPRWVLRNVASGIFIFKNSKVKMLEKWHLWHELVLILSLLVCFFNERNPEN